MAEAEKKDYSFPFEQAHKISHFADGVIVGSAIVKLIAEHGENAGDAVADYVSGMKNALR